MANAPRKYVSDTDYPIVLNAFRKCRESFPGLAVAANALMANQIQWPSGFNDDRSPEALAIDRDICRAWASLGLH